MVYPYSQHDIPAGYGRHGGHGGGHAGGHGQGGNGVEHAIVSQLTGHSQGGRGGEIEIAKAITYNLGKFLIMLHYS